jgi:preprotein translocase SecF subunit|tara:strand:- start:1078 stop:2019 length:942 start_codon:yes stop_codon:yes gene_type:complete
MSIFSFATNSKIKFLSLRKPAFILSLTLIICSVLIYSFKGLNFGIDFRGGTLIEVETSESENLSNLRSILNNLELGDIQVQEFGSAKNILIRVEQQAGGDQIQQNVVNIVKTALNTSLSSDVNFRRTEVVGPKVSSELIKAGIIAIVVAVFAMLVYIWFRFEWQFSLGAVIALIHDVLLTLGIFSLLQLEFNLSIIAAILTIVGYSMNDTVVVYDRVRENLRKYRKKEIIDLLNISINETLSRTIMTSVTTLLALLSLYIFGGSVIKGFTFAMIWGVLVGTYSSIFIAAPLLNYLKVKRDWSVSSAVESTKNN